MNKKILIFILLTLLINLGNIWYLSIDFKTDKDIVPDTRFFSDESEEYYNMAHKFLDGKNIKLYSYNPQKMEYMEARNTDDILNSLIRLSAYGRREKGKKEVISKAFGLEENEKSPHISVPEEYEKEILNNSFRYRRGLNHTFINVLLGFEL